jgi:hypothetical protein
MEGPYTVTAELQSSQILLKFMDRGRKSGEASQTTPLQVPITVLGSALFRAGTLTLSAAQQANWTGTDLDRLQARVKQVSQEMERYQ